MKKNPTLDELKCSNEGEFLLFLFRKNFFYHCSITVVQSYFVYWAGIESGLVRDQGRSSWSWSNAMRMDDTASTIALQKHQVTALPGR